MKIGKPARLIWRMLQDNRKNLSQPFYRFFMETNLMMNTSFLMIYLSFMLAI
jgi:hypothetical protein